MIATTVANDAMQSPIPSIPKNTANVPHNGAVTHHQDHVIWPVSLRTRNTINIAPPRPIPPELALSLINYFLLVDTEGVEPQPAKAYEAPPLTRRSYL